MNETRTLLGDEETALLLGRAHAILVFLVGCGEFALKFAFVLFGAFGAFEADAPAGFRVPIVMSGLPSVYILFKY